MFVVPIQLADATGREGAASLPCRGSHHVGADLSRLLFRLLAYRFIALPALDFEFYQLDGNHMRVGIEFRERLVFRHPTAVDVVCFRDPPPSVRSSIAMSFREIFHRDFHVTTRAVDEVRPFLTRS